MPQSSRTTDHTAPGSLTPFGDKLVVAYPPNPVSFRGTGIEVGVRRLVAHRQRLNRAKHAGFLTFLAVTVLRALINGYRINVMPVAAAEHFPLRQP